MSTDILSILDSALHRRDDIPHRVADGLKYAADTARDGAHKAARYVRHEAKAPLKQLKRDPIPALVALVGALCAARLLTRRRH